MKRMKKLFSVLLAAACTLLTVGCNNAKAPDYSASEKQYTFWAYHATYNGWHYGQNENGEMVETTQGVANSATDIRFLQDYKDCGFTEVFMSYAMYVNSRTGSLIPFKGSNAEKVMDNAHELGLKVFVHVPQFNSLCSGREISLINPSLADGKTYFASQEALNTYVANAVKDMVAHPAFLGFTIKDEPNYKNLTAMAEVAKAIRVVAPNAKIMANLLPIRNESLHKSWYCEGGANMTMKTAYRNYLDAVVEKLGIDYIQYDDYPILGDNVSKTSILDTHITNAQFVADYCKEKGLEFRKVFQTSSYRTGTPICRIPNETDMYWQMNIGMAMGIKEFSYWTYFPVVNEGEIYEHEACFVDIYGNKQDNYYTMKKIHGEMQGNAKALMNFEYQGMTTYTKTPIPGNKGYLAGVVKNELKHVSEVTLQKAGILLISELYDAANDQYGYYFVNITDPVQNQTISFEVGFEGFGNVQTYDAGQVSNAKLTGGKTTISLAAGKGVFVMPY